MAAVSVMARCGPGALRPPSSSSQPRRFQAGGAFSRTPFPCVRIARPLQTPPRASYRAGGSSWDEQAMKEVLQDMARMWKAANGPSGMGSVMWPGGGYTFGTGQRCNPCGPDAASGAHSSSSSSKALALDVVSTDGFYLLFADVPGLAKSDLSIKLSKERVLSLSGERKAPVDEGYSQRERRFGAFERAWSLPEDADSEGISAKVTEGVLTITVPKKQPEPVVDDAQDIAIA